MVKERLKSPNGGLKNLHYPNLGLYLILVKLRHRFLPVSILLMSAALIGTFALQVYWFKQAYELKSREFDSRVNMALIKTAERVEELETKSIIRNRLEPGVDYYPFYPDSMSATAIPSSALIDQTTFSIEEPQNETGAAASKQKMVLADGTELTLESSTIGQSITDSIRSALQKDAQRLFAEVMVELEAYKKKGFQTSNPEMVDSVLRATLRDFGIRSHYTGAVYLPEIDSAMLFRSTKSFTGLHESQYYIRLFPQFMFASPQFLVIDFTDKVASIVAELQTIILLFLIFSAIIVGVYSYTLRNFIRQRKLSDLKTDFINNMTHEFKTPIASISLAADSLKNPKILQNPDMILHYGEIIKEENRRMNRHIESVLQSAILEKNALELRREKVSIHALLEIAVDRARFQHRMRDIKVAEEYLADKDEVWGDELHLVNVFVNLLDNAVKYCDVHPEITVFTKNENNSIIISFTDNGIGIKKDNLKEIFHKFYRVPTGNLHNVKGFGLGLSYVKSISELHDGTVSADSIYGKGSTFSITLPLYINQQEEEKRHEHNI